MSAHVLQQGTQAAAQSAQRFMRLLQQQAPALDVPELLDCVLRVEGGMHAGAQLRLQQTPVRIGSASDNDIVLKDAGVLPHHAELRRLDNRWGIFVVGGDAALPPLQSYSRGRFQRQLHGIGAATLILSQRAQVDGGRSGTRRLVPGSWQVIASAFMLVVAALLASVAVAKLIPSDAVVQPAGAQSLAEHGWADVRLVVDESRRTRVEGYVADAAQLTNLKEWLQRNGYAQAPVLVRVGAEWAARVREALGQDTFQVDYESGGHVRVKGTTADITVRKRLQQLRVDVEPAVKLIDEVAYVDVPQPPKLRPLPFRITNVWPGETGSFTTDTGARYFVGAVLSDGAEVVSIEADAVEFRVDGKTVVYPLK